MRSLRVARRVAAGAVLLVAVAGCGRPDPAGAPAAATSESAPAATSESATATPPQGGTVLPKSQVDTSGLPDYYQVTDVVVSPDGRAITVNGMARDSCSSVEATVTETAESVLIVISPMATPQGGPPDQMCAQVLTPQPVTVHLKSPVGDRKVIVTEQA